MFINDYISHIFNELLLGNKPIISGSQQQTLTFCSQVCSLSGGSISGYGLSPGLLYLSLIMWPAADCNLLFSWEMANTQEKTEHASTLKSAQNTSTKFPLAKATHLAQINIRDECAAGSTKRHYKVTWWGTWNQNVIIRWEWVGSRVGGRDGWLGGVVRGKWRQLYLNNNKKLKEQRLEWKTETSIQIYQCDNLRQKGNIPHL